MIRVLIVDDSTVYRSQIRAALTGPEDVEVASSISSGRLALDWLKHNAVDVITLDLEMPDLNGLEVLRELRARDQRTRVIVFSATTPASADQALEALRLGAHDVVAKPTLAPGDGSPADLIRRHLLPKVRQFKTESPLTARAGAPSVPRVARVNAPIFPKVMVIASSTGGPDALERLFAMIAPPFNVPILIVQHMPPVFTATLAGRIARICKGDVAEARHGEVVRAGRVVIAPGDHHLRVRQTDQGIVTELDHVGPQRNFVRPAADYLFETAAQIWCRSCLGLVLTGMGADGRDGAVAIKAAGGTIYIQNKASCVVYGMPGAVDQAGAFDADGDLAALAEMIVNAGVAARAPEEKGKNAV